MMNFKRYLWGLQFALLFATSLQAYKLGIENIPADLMEELKNNRVGIVTNQTGVDQWGRRTIDVLRKKGANLTTIFVPEHGLDGTIAAGADVGNATDAQTGLPVVSLYQHGAGKTITKESLRDIDTLVFDIQDVGMRHYTYISTLYTVLEAAARDNKRIVVLDRPNPLGHIMEGPLCESSLRSFIGIAEIPLRHGMTVGELAQLFNNKLLQPKAEVTVVPLADFTRDMQVSTLKAHLSPNIKTMPAVHGYSFLGLVGEVKPFDVGVGTDHAFQLLALPTNIAVSKADWQALQQQFAGNGIPSYLFEYHHKTKQKQYRGLKVQIDDIKQVQSFKAFLSVLSWAKERQLPISFSACFDKAVGTPKVRYWFNGQLSQAELLQRVKMDLQSFLELHEDVLLYDAAPKVVCNHEWQPLLHA